jgi:hypothetical protein
LFYKWDYKKSWQLQKPLAVGIGKKQQQLPTSCWQLIISIWQFPVADSYSQLLLLFSDACLYQICAKINIF